MGFHLEGTSESIIEVRNLWHLYFSSSGAPVEAVRDANLRVRRGEVVGIIGQNGAGKTTFVKHFNGLLRPTRGSVLIDHNEAKEMTVAQLSRNVGYVFQNPDNMIFLDSVREEMRFGPRNLGMPPDETEKQVERVLVEFGLEGYGDESPYILSQALKRRLTVASVLSMKPKILVLDEPTIGQDRLMANKLMRYIIDLNLKEGLTVVLITHDMRIVAEFCPRAVVMANGEIVYDGETRELFTKDDVLGRAFLEPPQVTELSLRLSQHFTRPVLSVEELVSEAREIRKSS
ncbi:MAG: ATP-binding cassette domain-containing protein [Thaumarchaeota archaeon]|nr:MAG: ATP-binding cassette domain-containing protein [Nitrososphaerota archaeon]TLY14275.1 MAG: ATP-binding cassette domain-containing protein [Nitrososphaerota archaeon]TMQ01393.1 MAG: ATP-binding cassette domain-containing protein [Nitrososphaerota archaeon]